MMKRYTISVLVMDHPGVLQRVAGLFGRRGFNIESITVGASETSGLSRMTIVTSGDERTVEQVEKQLNKLIDVVKVVDVSSHPMVAGELAYIKVKLEPDTCPEIFGIVDTFHAAVVDTGPNSLIIQFVGELADIEAMIERLQPYGILEVCRTGTTAMVRGDDVTLNHSKLPRSYHHAR